MIKEITIDPAIDRLLLDHVVTKVTRLAEYEFKVLGGRFNPIHHVARSRLTSLVAQSQATRRFADERVIPKLPHAMHEALGQFSDDLGRLVVSVESAMDPFKGIIIERIGESRWQKDPRLIGLWKNTHHLVDHWIGLGKLARIGLERPLGQGLVTFLRGCYYLKSPTTTGLLLALGIPLAFAIYKIVCEERHDYQTIAQELIVDSLPLPAWAAFQGVSMLQA